MADLNALIAQGAQFAAPPDPFAQYGKMQQLRVGENQNALAQYQLESAKRTDLQQNALNEGYAQSVNPVTGELDYKRLTKFLAGRGAGSQIPAALKQQLEGRKLQTEADTAESNLLDAKLKQARGFLDTIDPTSPDAAERYIAWHKANHSDPIVGKALAARGITADNSFAQIDKALKTPGGLAKLIQQSMLGTEKFMEMNKPTLSTKDTGGSLIDRTFSPLTGEIKVLGTTKKTPTFADIAAQGNLKVAQDRLINDQTRLANEQDPTVVTRQTVGEDGTVTNFNKFGQVVGTVKGAGKASGTFAKAELQKKQLGKDLNLSISELTEATKDGGLIDQSTGSYLGKAVDISNRVFGRATKGDIAAGKLQPIADLALKMVPRFEGPQSNADTTSYKQAAGQLADTTLPTEIRKQAGREVLRIMKARKDQFVTSDMASGDVAVPSVAPPPGFTQD
jgi:hypothetical protein